MKLLSQQEAQQIDLELMDPEKGGFSLEVLMELAGLSVAQAIAKFYLLSEYPRILVLAGPGNNGGDALVAARHLAMFRYSVSVFCPKVSPKLQHLVKQCLNCNVVILDCMQIDCDLIVDGIFGFSFIGPVRAPFQDMLAFCKSTLVPIASIDVPSGWDVNLGPSGDDCFYPDMLISLTWPKRCSVFFNKTHVLGGRFIGKEMALRFGILDVYEDWHQYALM
jgi:NAD(P)H-hydrate epimerase